MSQVNSGMPLKPGAVHRAPGSNPSRIIPAGQLTAAELDDLRKAGVDVSRGVPDNMADLLAEINEDLNPANLPPPVSPDHPALSLPAETDINSLPPDRQRFYRSMLGDRVEQARRQVALGAATSTLPPSVRSAVMASDEAGAADNVRSVLPEPAAARPAESEEPVAAATDKAETGPIPAKCARCGWPAGKSLEVHPSEDDINVFLVSLLGLRPMVKKYSYFGGRVQVMVRSLATNEIDAIWRQISLDYRRQRIVLGAEEAERFNRYRTAFQVVSVSGMQQPFEFPQSLAEWEKHLGFQPKPMDESGLPADTVALDVLNYFTHAVANETLARLLQDAVGNFQTILFKLEGLRADENFWSAVGK